MDVSLNERVMEFHRWTLYSANKLAKVLGLPQRTIYNYTKGLAEPSQAFFLAVEKAFPEIDINYLKTGEGTLLKDGERLGDPFNMPQETELSMAKKLIKALEDQLELWKEKCAGLEEQLEIFKEMKDKKDK